MNTMGKLMPHETTLSNMSVDEILMEALRHERTLMAFYNEAMQQVGPDARLLMAHLHAQHGERIVQLEKLLEEISDLRELAAPIAD